MRWGRCRCSCSWSTPAARSCARCAATDTLIVGYGNDLRGDDAAGRQVAARLLSLGLPGVEVRSLHQLVPELAAELGDRRVIFVDAAMDTARIDVRRLDLQPPAWTTTHVLDPEAVLGLAAALDALPAEAFIVRLPAVSLGLGEGLSPTSTRAVDDAVEQIVALLR
jgi:hydrogenase maturation protease